MLGGLTVEAEVEGFGDESATGGGNLTAVNSLVPNSQPVAFQTLEATVSFAEGAVQACPPLWLPVHQLVLLTLERPEGTRI